MKNLLKSILVMLIGVMSLFPIQAKEIDSQETYYLNLATQDVLFYEYLVKDEEEFSKLPNDIILAQWNGINITKDLLDDNHYLIIDKVKYENLDIDYLNELQVMTIAYEIDDTISGNSKYNGTYYLPSSCNNATVVTTTLDLNTYEETYTYSWYMTRGVATRMAYAMEDQPDYVDVFNMLVGYIPVIGDIVSYIEDATTVIGYAKQSNADKIIDLVDANKKVLVTIDDGSFSAKTWNSSTFNIKNTSTSSKEYSSYYQAYYADFN